MFLYFYLLDQTFFQKVMRPALTRSHRQKSFAPCHDLCQYLLTKNPATPHDALARAIALGLAFDRPFWHALVGECLVHGADDIPRLQTSPATLTCLLAPQRYGQLDSPRSQYTPIEQAHFGTRDLVFGGGYHRPDHVGLNDWDDVRRLAEYLESVDPSVWTVAALQALAGCADDEDRAEDLAYVRDWWPSLVELYQKARAQSLVVVCETV